MVTMKAGIKEKSLRSEARVWVWEDNGGTDTEERMEVWQEAVCTQEYVGFWLTGLLADSSTDTSPKAILSFNIIFMFGFVR